MDKTIILSKDIVQKKLINNEFTIKSVTNKSYVWKKFGSFLHVIHARMPLYLRMVKLEI